MTAGRWLYALGILMCIFQTDALAESEVLALARDALFLLSMVLVWRESDGPRLVEIGWLGLIAALVGGAANATLVTSLMAVVAIGMLVGGYRSRTAVPALLERG